jgi:hypothetical protein
MKYLFELRAEGHLKFSLKHTDDALDEHKVNPKDLEEYGKLKAKDPCKELMLAAYQNNSYKMIAYLLKLGLRAKRVWGEDESKFIGLRNYYLKDAEYGFEFANKYFCCTN